MAERVPTRRTPTPRQAIPGLPAVGANPGAHLEDAFNYAPECRGANGSAGGKGKADGTVGGRTRHVRRSRASRCVRRTRAPWEWSGAAIGDLRENRVNPGRTRSVSDGRRLPSLTLRVRPGRATPPA